MRIYYYIIKRFLYGIPILVGVTLLIFVLFQVVAGDPTVVLLGKYATAQARAALRHELGLDRPWVLQYLDTLQAAFTFNFGRSWATKQQIIAMLKQGIGVSLRLSLPTLLLSNLLALSFSLGATFFRGKLLDSLLVVISVMMMSIPSLAYILLGQWLFAYQLGWFPIVGYASECPALYLMLPIMILVVLHIGADIRFYRTVLIDEIYQDYVRTARAKGLSEPCILVKHVLKNALIPIITNISTQFPALLLGVVLIENFFSIPGVGSVVLQAINSSDFPVIKAVTILFSVVFIVLNTMTDVLYACVDPRIKLQ